jgi:hypothetical protein
MRVWLVLIVAEKRLRVHDEPDPYANLPSTTSPIELTTDRVTLVISGRANQG